jgi:adenosine deaminase/aminodeoxyfutalosine deaminase
MFAFLLLHGHTKAIATQMRNLPAPGGVNSLNPLDIAVLFFARNPRRAPGYTGKMSEIADFIRRLPKAELHLHLEGTITPATLVELSQRHDARPIPLSEAEALYRFTDFTGFIEAFRAVTRLLTSPDDYELAAWRMMQRLAEQGVVHAEVFISVGVIYMWRNHDPDCFEPIFAGLEQARERAARELGLSVYWIFDAVRHFTVEEAARVFRKAAEMRRQYPSIIGIGLGGDERLAGSEPFRSLYAEAREAGLRLTNHAGETTGPDAIREALAIGSERIGHALSAIDDPELMEEMKERGIPLELNPTSNVRTGVCASFASHPLRRYFERGLLVTLNSDDPAFFGSDLANEYLLAHTEQAFTREELRQLAANSIRASFLPEIEKPEHLRRIESVG